MRAMQLNGQSLQDLQLVEIDTPRPGPGEVLLRHRAASINYRDYQICTGTFAPDAPRPIVPCSDGAGEVVEVGEEVTEYAPGDRASPLFFPEWQSGPALGAERSISTGLEEPGVLREYGLYRPHQLVPLPDCLSDEEAACLPCAGLTAWTCVRDLGGIGNPAVAGDEQWVLLEGTGGVSIFALQFARALGARVILLSSSAEKLERARELGADHLINYREQPEWGMRARELTGGRGVDCVVEIGGEGTLPQAVRALRRDGHIGIVGYLAGIGLGLSVFDMIERNANLHGVSVGNRDAFLDMLRLVEEASIHPVIHRRYTFDEARQAMGDIASGEHIGKLVVSL